MGEFFTEESETLSSPIKEEILKTERESSDELPARMNPRILWAMTIGCCVSVGNLYYIQPLLPQVESTFHVSPSQSGYVATLCQVGYALGMLFIVPLGDAVERRLLIVSTLAINVLVLLLFASSPSMGLLYGMALLLGISTSTPQLLVPFAAHLAAPKKRSEVVGTVMSGLLIGILLARTVGGFVGSSFGWRAMFYVAAGMMLLLALVLRFTLPVSKSDGHNTGYVALLKSLSSIWKSEPVLRESAVFGALAFASFSAFWTTLAFLLSEKPYHFGPSVVGLFGLVGVGGAVAAPLIGRLGDKGNPRRNVFIALGVLMSSFVIMGLFSWSLVALVIGTLLLDVGTQSAQVSNQSRIYSLAPGIRNRLNTIYMTIYFIGGSLGSAAGAFAWERFGWWGVCGIGIGSCAVGMGFHRFRGTSIIDPLEP